MAFTYFDYADEAKLKTTMLDRFCLRELNYANAYKYLGITRTELRTQYTYWKVQKVLTLSAIYAEIEAEEMRKLKTPK